MTLLWWAQRRAGPGLGSGSVVAGSKQTLLCTYLSAVLLVGLRANVVLGWSWADPLAALVIAVVAVREGIEAWRGETCECGLHSRLAEVSMSRLRAAPTAAAAHRKRVTTVLRRELGVARLPRLSMR